MPYMYGQLLVAQLENSQGIPPSGGTPAGRVYIDVTNGSNGLPMFHNGTAYVPIGSAVMTSNSTATAAFNTNGNSETIYNTAGATLASLSLTLPASTQVGQILRYITKPAVTSVSVAGTIVAGASVTSFAANGIAAYQAINTTGSFVRIS